MRSTKRWFPNDRALAASLLLALLLLGPAPAWAAEAPLVRAREKLVIDAVGDGRFTVDVKMPVALYTLLKDSTRNTALLFRQIGLSRDESYEPEDMKGEFDDGNSTLRFAWTRRGLARQVRDQVWEAPIEETGGLEVLYVRGNVALFNVASSSMFGVVPLVVQAEVEHGAGLQILHSPGRLAYHVPVARSSAGGRTAFDFDLQSKPQIMSCLAKTYGNPRFGKFWVGRAILRNTGAQHLNDYRVRFRLREYAPAWSAWKQCSEVVPGQTVADPYFPILDLDRVGRLSGSCRDTLEVEYHYRRPDGQLVEASDSRTIQLLGRNEVFYSSRTAADCGSWYDRNEYGPTIMASFVTKDDPIIQQVAGWVSGQAGGVAASESDQNAIQFAQALYEFMTCNGLCYQTPPGGEFNGQSGQHIKFGRDVLQNRAGTCIDLAVLYGSVCEAVGLDPVLFLMPGHCFPAVRLPKSRQLLAVETTGVPRASFAQVTGLGQKEIQDARSKGPVYEIDIVALHNQGIYGLQLPALPTTALTDWGIHPATQSSGETAAKVEQPKSIPSWLIGKWKCDTKLEDTTIQIVAYLDEDGGYEVRQRHTNDFGRFTDWKEDRGSFHVDARQLVFARTAGQKDAVVKRAFEIEDGYLWISFNEIGYRLPFRRAEVAAQARATEAEMAPATVVYMPAPVYYPWNSGGSPGRMPGHHHRGRR